jgi:hypothetical protein
MFDAFVMTVPAETVREAYGASVPPDCAWGAARRTVRVSGGENEPVPFDLATPATAKQLAHAFLALSVPSADDAEFEIDPDETTLL